MNEGQKPRGLFDMSAEESRTWLERMLADGIDDSECGVGGYMFRSEAELYENDIPLPPLSGGAVAESVTTGHLQVVDVNKLRHVGAPMSSQMIDPYVTPYPGPLAPAVPMFPSPSTPVVPWSPIVPPGPWDVPYTDPKEEQRRMNELAALLKLNSKNADKEKKMEGQLAKLKAENAELKAELYYLRNAAAILASDPVRPTMLSGPFPIGDDSFEVVETVRAAILYHMLTPAAWEALSLIEMAKLILAYVEAASTKDSVPNPRQYQSNLETGMYS